jgi:Tfp pilus tip-associated adhesin PilY1
MSILNNLAFGYNHITTNTTTTVKKGSGVLHAIVINTKGASANTVTIYDNTSASSPVIAVLDSTSAVGSLNFDAYFSTGLTIVTATGTAPDMTVIYR